MRTARYRIIYNLEDIEDLKKLRHEPTRPLSEVLASSISMARYRVEISRTAERQLKQLPPEDRQRVARAVVEKAKLTVLVLRIGHRKHVYR